MLLDNKNTMILSFDIGLKNFAYCVLSHDGKTIHHWENMNITAEANDTTNDKRCLLIYTKLTERMSKFEDCDIVLIERQMNKTMMIISAFVEMYFTTHGKEVVTYNASNKLENMEGNKKGKRNYSNRKKLSVELTKAFLKDNPQDKEIVDMFYGLTKKDDASDALLQAVSYVKNPPKPAKDKKTPTVIRCRAPSEKQLKRKKLSKHNLKFLITELIKSGKEKTVLSFGNKLPLEILIEKDPLLAKGITRFYKTPLEALTGLGFVELPPPPPLPGTDVEDGEIV